MEIKVTNCGNCIFRNSDYDPDCVGEDTYDTCSLLRHKNEEYFIAAYNSWDDKIKLETTLPNCPLLKENIIVSYGN